MKMMKVSQVKDCKFALRPDSSDENWYVFDLETNGLYDDVNEIFCIVLYDVTRKQTLTFGPDSIDSALQLIANADVLIGHNIIFYDIPVIRKLYPDLLNKQQHVIDTLICTRLIWPKEKLFDLDFNHYHAVPPGLRGSAGLKAWGYRLSDNKIDFKDFSQYSQEMLDYCVQDVNVTHRLFQHIQKQTIAESSYQLEHDFAHAIERQIRSGFPFDVDQCLDLVDGLERRKTEIEAKLKEIFPPIEHEEWFTPKVNNAKRGYVKGVPFRKVRKEEFNPGSRQQIIDRLKSKYNWQPTNVTDKGNAILDDDVAWLKLVSPEGYMHGDLITNGCITGRASHRNPNMGQVPAAYSSYGKECRSLFHAPDNWVLIGADAKALELRCLAGYLAIWDHGEYGNVVIDDAQDIHTYNQEMFGVATRDISKRLLYGILYGCGHLKAGSIINPEEKDEDRLRAMGRSAIDSFYANVPALQKLKETLNKNLTERGHLFGLDRRPLYCRSDFKALNVLLQSAGAILMKQVVINVHNALESNDLIYGKHWHQHAMIHDEIQLSCVPGLEKKIIELVLQAFVDAGDFYGFRCKIEGDAKTGYNWFNTH
jgi:hypothetical protein